MSEAVKNLFASIAPDYDRANQVLSLGVHARWRRAAVRLSGVAPGERVLDCACGTGDLAFAFGRAVGRAGQVAGVDLCAPMIERARAKAHRRGASVAFAAADALALPFASASFDAASIAFGIRNVDDPVRGLREMARVVRPGGRVVVLEFGQPSGWAFGPLFRLYSRWVIPAVGGAVSGNRAAYDYLYRTSAVFPSGDRFLALMDQTCTFAERHAHSLTFGTAYVYVGVVAKSDPDRA